MKSHIFFHLLPGFDFRGYQAYFVHTRRVRNVDHLGHVSEWDVIVALYKHNALGAGLKDIGQTRLQVIPSFIVLIDFEFWTLARSSLHYLNHDSAIIWFLLFLLIFRRLRNERIQTPRSQRRNHHEDDQQNQQDVDEWRYIDIRAGTSTVVPNCHCHIEIL